MTPGARSRVTSADVARRAGVSRATVSYVVNGVSEVRLAPKTRERVLAAAAELGYSQYGPARTLKSGRSDVVLFVLSDLPVGHAVNTLLDELEARLAVRDLSLVIFRISQRGNRLSRIWREIGPCAVVGLDAVFESEAAEMRAAGIDVFLMNLVESSGLMTQSQLEVGETQVRYLASRGRHRLGYAYPDDQRVETFSSLRLRGARSACRDLGIPDPDVRTIPLDRARAATEIAPWLEGPTPVSGVCAYNDVVAFAVLSALEVHGVEVPGGVAVIGVDNDPVGELISPTLTTVDIHHVDMADEIADLVVSARDGVAPPRRPPHPATVVARGSTP